MHVDNVTTALASSDMAPIKEAFLALARHWGLEWRDRRVQHAV